ncbi:MAG: hypothetical protein E6G66_17945, partial [Actinobacteria bacterium]
MSLEKRSWLLDRLWEQRIIRGLQRSLGHAAELELSLEGAPDLLELSYGSSIDGHTRVTLFEAYELSHQQLVIVGPPGSGKTTLALILLRR